MTWAVTGGLGYIGAHVVHELIASGRDVVILDDMSTGEDRRLPAGTPLVRTSILDTRAVRDALRAHEVDGVVHLAAKKAVGESVGDPVGYYAENVGGLVSLAQAMSEAGVSRMVYSSSAAVYGAPAVETVSEDTVTEPISPYGETKLVGEWLLRDVARSAGWSVAALRYFNVAGSADDHLGDSGAFNLVPLVLRSWTRGERPAVFGGDYPTPDGTCVRDYIHVQDVAAAHVAAVAAQEAGSAGFEVYNLGRGVGSSVLEVIESVGRAVGRPLDPEVVPRRPGDPARLVADPARARELLGWTATRDLDDMTASAWSAWQRFPVS